MIVLALLLVALALAWPAPRLLPRAVGLREVPMSTQVSPSSSLSSMMAPSK